jgi:hypothetical protein
MQPTGKPHPRWADTNFRDGDPNEKWHSRANKSPEVKRRHSPDALGDRVNHQSRGTILNLLTPIKTESVPDIGQSHLYRFSPSPDSSMRYHNYQTGARSPTALYDTEQRTSYNAGLPPSGGASSVPFHTSTHMANISYNNHHAPGPPVYGAATGAGSANSYHVSSSDYDRRYEQYSPDTTQQRLFCPCRTNPAVAPSFIVLTQQLQGTLNVLRQYSPHPPSTNCLVYKRITELSNLMQYVKVLHFYM